MNFQFLVLWHPGQKDPESISGILGPRWEYTHGTMDAQTSAHSFTLEHSQGTYNIFLDSGRKPTDAEETRVD